MNILIKYVAFFAAVFFVNCNGKEQSINGLLLFDVTKNYPWKELILQDFMDVGYFHFWSKRKSRKKNQSCRARGRRICFSFRSYLR